jgi:small subunit ribosomal protein S17
MGGRTITGTVTSDKVDKTIVITVVTRKTHPLYKKQYSVKSKFMAHDENNEAKLGDRVIISETKPISSRKRFMLTQVVEKAGVAFVATDATSDVPEEPKKAESKVEPKAPAKAEPKAANVKKEKQV